MDATDAVEKRFWVLQGTPQGPYPLAELHQQARDGSLSPETLVCEVGASEWQPYSRWQAAARVEAQSETLALVTTAEPPIPPRTGAITPVVESQVASKDSLVAIGESSRPPEKVPRKSLATPIGVKIGIAACAIVACGLAYAVYEIVRPPTPMEVCRRFERAETVVEAKKYATVRMYPFLEKAFAEKTLDDPNDTFEWTREVEGPDATVRHVGFRGSWFMPEDGQRMKVEGYFRMVESNGWKVDDMVFTGLEGRSLPSPLSVVGEVQKSGGSFSSTKSKPSTRSTNPTEAPPPFKLTPIGIFKWLQHRPAIEVAGIVGLVVIALVIWSRTVNSSR